MKQVFHPHEIEWTNDKVRRIWDYRASTQTYQTENFPNLAGESILNLLKNHKVPLRGKMLDFGCGTGALMEKLISRGIACQGAELSKVSVNTATAKLSHHRWFEGVKLIDKLPTPFETGKFHLVFLLETLEHILSEEMEPTIREIYRITKNNGYIVITTPNQENLNRGKKLCPECGCIFHDGQHVRSWDSDALSRFVTNAGFKMILCKPMTFRPKSRFNFFREMVSRIEGHKKQSLILLGQKR